MREHFLGDFAEDYELRDSGLLWFYKIATPGTAVREFDLKFPPCCSR